MIGWYPEGAAVAKAAVAAGAVLQPQPLKSAPAALLKVRSDLIVLSNVRNSPLDFLDRWQTAGCSDRECIVFRQ